MKIRAVELSCSLRGDGQKSERRTDTEVTKLTVALRNSARAPKIYLMRISWFVQFFSFFLLLFYFFKLLL